MTDDWDVETCEACGELMSTTSCVKVWVEVQITSDDTFMYEVWAHPDCLPVWLQRGRGDGVTV